MRHDGLNWTDNALRRTAQEFSANRIKGEDLPLILEWIAAMSRNSVEAARAIEYQPNEFESMAKAASDAVERLDRAGIDTGYIRR